jgi:hypothetical protein
MKNIEKLLEESNAELKKITQLLNEQNKKLEKILGYTPSEVKYVVPEMGKCHCRSKDTCL